MRRYKYFLQLAHFNPFRTQCSGCFAYSMHMCTFQINSRVSQNYKTKSLFMLSWQQNKQQLRNTNTVGICGNIVCCNNVWFNCCAKRHCYSQTGTLIWCITPFSEQLSWEGWELLFLTDKTFLSRKKYSRICCNNVCLYFSAHIWGVFSKRLFVIIMTSKKV